MGIVTNTDTRPQPIQEEMEVVSRTGVSRIRLSTYADPRTYHLGFEHRPRVSLDLRVGALEQTLWLECKQAEDLARMLLRAVRHVSEDIDREKLTTREWMDGV